MPEFNFADAVTCLLSRVNFVGLPHLAEMQKLRRSAQAKA
jgi:hypothetical protein